MDGWHKHSGRYAGADDRGFQSLSGIDRKSPRCDRRLTFFRSIGWSVARTSAGDSGFGKWAAGSRWKATGTSKSLTPRFLLAKNPKTWSSPISTLAGSAGPLAGSAVPGPLKAG